MSALRAALYRYAWSGSIVNTLPLRVSFTPLNVSRDMVGAGVFCGCFRHLGLRLLVLLSGC